MLTFRLPKRYFSILFSSFRLSRAKRRFVCCCLTAFSARARVRCRAFCRDADLLFSKRSAETLPFGLFLVFREPVLLRLRTVLRFREPAPFGAVLYSILYIRLFRAFSRTVLPGDFNRYLNRFTERFYNSIFAPRPVFVRTDLPFRSLIKGGL